MRSSTASTSMDQVNSMCQLRINPLIFNPTRTSTQRSRQVHHMHTKSDGINTSLDSNNKLIGYNYKKRIRRDKGSKKCTTPSIDSLFCKNYFKVIEKASNKILPKKGFPRSPRADIKRGPTEREPTHQRSKSISVIKIGNVISGIEDLVVKQGVKERGKFSPKAFEHQDMKSGSYLSQLITGNLRGMENKWRISEGSSKQIQQRRPRASTPGVVGRNTKRQRICLQLGGIKSSSTLNSWCDSRCPEVVHNPNNPNNPIKEPRNRRSEYNKINSKYSTQSSLNQRGTPFQRYEKKKQKQTPRQTNHNINTADTSTILRQSLFSFNNINNTHSEYKGNPPFISNSSAFSLPPQFKNLKLRNSIAQTYFTSYIPIENNNNNKDSINASPVLHHRNFPKDTLQHFHGEKKLKLKHTFEINCIKLKQNLENANAHRINLGFHFGSNGNIKDKTTTTHMNNTEESLLNQ